jgi:hypothetical protein
LIAWRGRLHTIDKAIITLGVRYLSLGATTSAVGENRAGVFRHNSAIVGGLRLGYRF